MTKNIVVTVAQRAAATKVERFKDVEALPGDKTETS